MILRAIGLALAVFLALPMALFAGPYQRFWSEDFESYQLGDLLAQDPGWSITGDIDALEVDDTEPFFPSDQGLVLKEAGGPDNTKYGGSAVINFNYAPFEGVILWQEDFQTFTAAENTGSPIVPQDPTWALTALNTSDHHANVADRTYDNGLGWPNPGWSYFGDLPVGENVLAVQGKTTSPQTGDGIVTATKTLPTLGATKTTLTASATICTIYGTNRWYTAEFIIGDSGGNTIVNLFFNILSAPGATVILNGTRLDETHYPDAGVPYHTGAPHDYDFVMDFDNDTVDMYLDDILIVAGVPMDDDYSPADVQTVTARITPYTQNDYQGISYYDNLIIWEEPAVPVGPTETVGQLLDATDSRRLALEFDAWIYLNTGTPKWEEVGYHLQNAAGADIVYLVAYNNSDALYQFNGTDIPGAIWASGLNHYLMDLDFIADTADLYINYESTPRLNNIALGADFEPADIDQFKLDAIINFRPTTAVNNYLDNIELYDNRVWDCPQSDFTGDCIVDLFDFSVLADNWLVVGVDPNDPNAV